ncbi:CCA tRNA nucleotidyltransferase, partial [Streptomyces sp. SID11233]|nr:CCA tRNA nucleotidyltransferase [Streptomyces sp. SID11233]
EIMALLDVPPGPVIGKAYAFLLDLRMEKGPLGKEAAGEALKEWWSTQQR